MRYFILVAVPNEEPKSPVFKTFPQSATVQEGENVSFECEIEKVPQKGEFLLPCSVLITLD